MTITSLRGTGHGQVRDNDLALRTNNTTTRLALHQLGTHTDGVDTQQRNNGLQGLGSTVTTGATTSSHDSSGTATSLIDTAQSELSGAHDALSDSLQGSSLSTSSLNSLSGASGSKDLKVNPDGSITTPGGYTIFNDGGWQWRIKDPSGLETKIWGDPHVDEGNDGKDDWHFNTDGTFILGDGTKIFCDTSQYNGGQVTVSDMLKIQSGDSLGTMDTKNGGPGTVTGGGLAYDSMNGDGALFIQGLDGKFYDGATLGKLVADPNGGYAAFAEGNLKGRFSNEALSTLHRAQAEVGAGAADHGGPLDERLATLINLENNAFLVDDSGGAATEAAKKHGKLAGDKVLGQANQVDKGMPSLAAFDKNGDGKLSGAELDGVKVSIDKNNDGAVDDGELKLLAEFNINELQVRLAVQNQQDGTTRLQGQLVRDGNTIHTNDRLNPLNDGAQANNFQRGLLNAVGNDPAQRALAGDRIDAANRALQRARDEQVAAGEGGRLAGQAGQHLLNANIGGTRA